MNMKTEALIGGFSEPVFHSQSVFRMVMDAMARPGTLQTVAPEVAPPAPLGIAAGAIALTLCDHDTPVWLSAGLAKSAIPEWLGFHTGAALTADKSEARFAFVESGVSLPPLCLLSAGSQEYPDRSATVVIEIAGFQGGRELALTGPGIETVTTIAPAGLPDAFIRLWTDNRALFPRGVDVILTADRKFLCLPRTTKITATEM